MSWNMPSVEECFVPLLMALSNGEPAIEQVALQTAKREGFKALASVVHIQTDKRGVPVIQRRIAWAKFYLNAAGYIQHRSRNLIQITEEGLQALKQNACTWKQLAATPAWRQKFGPGWLPPQAAY